MKIWRLVGAALLVFVPVIPFTTTAAPEDTDATLQPTAAAWFQPNPTCPTPLGCSTVVPPPISPYPEDTIHVGVSGGQERARAFVAFPLRTVSGVITSAALTLPLVTDPLSGDNSASTADLAVCLTQVPIEPVRGSFEAPPSTDCSAAATARYVASPQPHFTADLAPMADALAAATGVVVLPNSLGVTPTDSWRVVFDAAAPRLAVSVAAEPEDVPEMDTVFVPDLSASLVDPPLGTSFAPSPPANSAPTVEGGAVDRGEPMQIATSRYPYKAVWLLPLVVLSLAPMIVNALTKDVTPRAGS